MNKLLYPRLAARSMRKNGRFTFPYLLTVIGTAAAFYIILALNFTGELPGLRRYEMLSMFLTIGIFVLALFTIIFLFYSNSFLARRRQKELGLYNVLGMDKRNLGILLSFETLYTYLLGVGGGVLTGMLLQKLVTMLVSRIVRSEEMFPFVLSGRAVVWTALWFGVILLLTLLRNLLRLGRQKPVELLRGGEVGEREPKTRWLLAVLGVLCLGGGYAIAILVTNAIQAVGVYFIAVFLVIIGTYCLFSALSIVILKALRKNKGYYYKTPHFIGVSGMLHRMNRNAVGLANICILSTMVLVMISATVSLYLGTEDTLHRRYPYQINARIGYDPAKGLQTDQLGEMLRAAVEREGLTVTESLGYTTASLDVNRTGSGFSWGSATPDTTLIFLTAEGYQELTGEEVRLAQGELLTDAPIPADGELRLTITGLDSETSFSYRAASLPMPVDVENGLHYTGEVYHLVLLDEMAIREVTGAARDAWGMENDNLIFYYFGVNIDAGSAQQIETGMRISDPWEVMLTGPEYPWYSFAVETLEGNRAEYYMTNGGFFFLGIFLGIIFLMAMVLIIYYKQISEGYEDRQRFQIIRQVGLEKREIRRSINRQVLVVFFAPLLVAGIHVLFDFPILFRMMSLFGLTNRSLAAWCGLGTFGVFALFYGAVYTLTAKSYYHIVSE